MERSGRGAMERSGISPGALVLEHPGSFYGQPATNITGVICHCIYTIANALISYEALKALRVLVLSSVKNTRRLPFSLMAATPKSADPLP
jgi:hypothetical protein